MTAGDRSQARLKVRLPLAGSRAQAIQLGGMGRVQKIGVGGRCQATPPGSVLRTESKLSLVWSYANLYSVNLNANTSESKKVTVSNSVIPGDRLSPWSLSIWFKTSNSAAQKAIFCRRLDAPLWTGIRVEMYPGNDRIVCGLFSDYSANNYLQTYETVGSWADGAWHHLVITYDGSSTLAGVIFYVDATLRAKAVVPAVSTRDTLTGSIVNAQHGTFGFQNSVTYPDPWIGKLTKPYIYNAVLTLAQVVELNACPDPRLCTSAPNLTNAWWFGDGDVSPMIIDHVGWQPGVLGNGAAFALDAPP